MDVLLRELVDVGGGRVETRDRELSADRIEIGSAADQNFRLVGDRIASRHATITRSGRGLVITVRSNARVRVNGAEKAEASLAVGDTVEIGANVLTVIVAPAGFDVAFEVRAAATSDPRRLEAAFKTDLDSTWLAKRPTAWLLTVIVGLATFGIPYLAARRGPIATRLPAWAPTDALWSPGPLSPAHQNVAGTRCQVCHARLFETVRDSACLTCHTRITDHVTPEHLAMTSLGALPACTTCHLEHQDVVEAFLDRRDDKCVDCHADSARRFGKLARDAVTGFGDGKHPPVRPDISSTSAVPLDGRYGPEERSNLKFSHAKHLNGDKVSRPIAGGATAGGPSAGVKSDKRRALGCVDCHKLTVDGEHFEPITMMSRCANSGCHQLTFDPRAPDRQLPHGKPPREIVLSLLEYYSRKFTDPAAADKVAAEPRRIPGREDEPARNPPCQGPAYECARQAAAKEAAVLFKTTGCVTCHVVLPTNSRDLLEAFRVEPIKMGKPDFYPAARFPHNRHLVVQGATGDGACLKCHPAMGSEFSSDILIPGLTVCESCHSDRPVVNMKQVGCLSCHSYHPHETGRESAASGPP